MKPLGLVLIAAGCLLPLVWLPGIAVGRDGIALFSQYLGLLALIAMAFGQVIATRWPGVETAFGPMDQSYRVHKWLGIGAMVAVLLHDTIDAEMDGLGRETLLVEIAETLGEISLYGLLVLVVITVATFIPYHLWKWTHRLIGVFFVFGAAHYLFILKPFANGDPLGLYMAAVCLVGTLAYLWTSAPRGWRPAQSYRITGLTREGSALAVEMAPSGRAIKHRPGQFAFFAFTGAGLIEPHPFTISSAPREDGGLQVTIAPLGDLTGRIIDMLRVDQDVRVDGPFGRFGHGGKKPQLWVAAGVGVTPFVALAEALDPNAPPVQMLYAVRKREHAAHLPKLEALAAEKPNLSLLVRESAVEGRLEPETIAEIVGPEIREMRVSFCGPVALRKSLANGLRRHGVTQQNFHYEAFEIRTGIGLGYLTRWLWTRTRERAGLS